MTCGCACFEERSKGVFESHVEEARPTAQPTLSGITVAGGQLGNEAQNRQGQRVAGVQAALGELRAGMQRQRLLHISGTDLVHRDVRGPQPHGEVTKSARTSLSSGFDWERRGGQRGQAGTAGWRGRKHADL